MWVMSVSDYAFQCACSLCAGGPTLHAGDAATGSASATKPSLSLTGVQSQLRTQWGGSQEGHTWTWLGTNTVSYSINANVTGVSEAAGLVQMTALMQDRARLAFELWDDVIALSLNESTNNPNANITFNYSSQTGGGTYAYWNGYYAGSDFGISRAYVWLNSGWSSSQSGLRPVFRGLRLHHLPARDRPRARAVARRHL